MQCLKCGNDFEGLYECPLCAEIWRKSSRFNRVVTRIEDALIILFLFLMLAAVLAQILMRNLFQSGIPGAEALIRHLVLWIAFMGAGVASRSRSHVRIDVLSHFVKGRFKNWMDITVDGFSCLVCATLMAASCRFVFIEWQTGNLSTLFGLPVWILQLIMPAGYLVIAIRFALTGFSALQTAVGRNSR